MSERRVAITGLGLVTPAGLGADELWRALEDGRSCVSAISHFDSSGFECRIGGRIEDFSARKFVPKSYRKAVKVMARDIEIAVAAADLAFKDAGVVTRADGAEETTYESRRLACDIGAGLICTDLNELGEAFVTCMKDGQFDMKAWGAEGMGKLTPLWLLKYLPNMLACHVTIIHGCEGPSNAITCGSASGHLSIGEAARWIQRGDADAAIAGGVESKLNPMAMMRQTLLKRLCASGNDSPQDACKPFSPSADGTVVGEGGGLLLLEEMECARKRGAKIYAELVGFASACDPEAIDVTRPTIGSLDLALRAAIKDAGISPDEVSMIVAHGTGVKAEDDLETEAWRKVLVDSAPPAVAVTSATGSLFAGAGGVELALAAMALDRQTVPPTVNCDESGGGLALSGESRGGEYSYALTGAFSVGGQSVACVLKKYEQ